MSLSDVIPKFIEAIRPGQLFPRLEDTLRDYPDTDLSVVFSLAPTIMPWLDTHPAVRGLVCGSVQGFMGYQKKDSFASNRHVEIVFQGKAGVHVMEISVRASSDSNVGDLLFAPRPGMARVLIVLEGPQQGTALWWNDQRSLRRPDAKEQLPDSSFWQEPVDDLNRFLVQGPVSSPWKLGAKERIFGNEVIYEEVAL